MTDNNTLNKTKAVAYWVYLDFCNSIGEVPRKEVYNQIRTCNDGQALDRITTWIESNHSNYDKLKKHRSEAKKKGFWSRILKF